MTHRGMTILGGLAASGAMLAVAPAPALAKTPPLPPSGKLTYCHKVVYKAYHTPVRTAYGRQKGKHPKKSLLSCTNANAVAKKGKPYADDPYKVGKKITVSGVTYTLEETHGASYDGKPLSSPEYGWVGGGVVILLVEG